MGKHVMLLSLLFVCSAVTAWALGTSNNEGYVQTFENGEVNWQSGLVTAVGIGAPPANAVNMAQARALARRAAIVVARRNLLEIIKRVRIDSAATVGEYMVTNDAIRTSVSGYLHNSQIYDVAYMSDGSVEATVGVSLRGGLAQIVIPKTMPFKVVEPALPTDAQESVAAPMTQPTESTSAASASSEPADVTEPVSDEHAPAQPAPAVESGMVVTGLVVDASGSGAHPAMSPKIIDEQGNEVYGSALVSREYAIQQGMAGYARDVEQAKVRPRVTDQPLVVRALSAMGKGMSDLVISNADANKLRALTENQDFFEKCRVMIVLD
ncbi:hypothetical protein DPF_2263 [Desulfoplanes formicivorans]|uniref:LPP20 lipoprotein n=2 Tax=Desulfoplanes formicivorans TaxID=1592317 RepID=A0A194AKF4_9BACT|nr:hypothetical protein DPF_2263 [Desulfoplanes formicivorans]